MGLNTPYDVRAVKLLSFQGRDDKLVIKHRVVLEKKTEQGVRITNVMWTIPSMTYTLIRMCGTRENNQVVFPEGLKITRIGKFRYGGRDYAKTRLFWTGKEEEAAVVPVGKEENNVERKKKN